MVHTAFAIPKNTGDDVGENPGPTIFDIIDPTTTVSTDSSQGNEAIFGVNAGKNAGSLFMTSNIGPYMSLRNSLLEVFSNS